MDGVSQTSQIIDNEQGLGAQNPGAIMLQESGNLLVNGHTIPKGSPIYNIFAKLMSSDSQDPSELDHLLLPGVGDRSGRPPPEVVENEDLEHGQDDGRHPATYTTVNWIELHCCSKGALG